VQHPAESFTDPGIVHKDVNPPCGSVDGFERSGNLSFIGDIRNVHTSDPALGSDVRRSLFQAPQVDIDQHDIGAGTGQCMSKHATETAGGASHDSCLPGQGEQAFKESVSG